MGIGVSGWLLAQTVSSLGHLGMVSGTALDSVLARRLQLGDPGGFMAQALTKFPIPEMVQRVWDRYFIDGGKDPDKPFQTVPVHSLNSPVTLVELTVLANFVEVTLAKLGHAGVVGINFLEKIQLPTLPSIYGAMLAGVDYILMGAGIPKAIPGIIDSLAKGEPVKMRVDVEGSAPGEEHYTHFDPAMVFGGKAPELPRPRFLPIISSATLAMTLAKKSSGRVDGFVVEGPLAGGHNAPPRGVMQLSGSGEPIYGERDVPELAKIKALGLPFWLAGDFARPGKLKEALALGAVGVQVGTAFAYCEESGIDPEIKHRVLDAVQEGRVRVFTDPVASPTGFPFKSVLNVEGTANLPESYASRTRICDMGYLRHLYKRPDGTVGLRCPSEPVEHYLKKGGSIGETVGRACLCNGLMATISLGQLHKGDGVEKPLLTAGDDLVNLARFFKNGSTRYHAKDVLDSILSDAPEV